MTRNAAPLLADVVERADVGMRQLGDGACLAVEALAELRIGGELLRQDLDRDGPIEPRIPGPVHLAHSTFAKFCEDLIRAEPGT
jgi:hypothetical protein